MSGICSCGLIAQSKAGTYEKDGVVYCKRCFMPTEIPAEAVRTTLSGEPTATREPSAPRVMTPIQAATKSARSAADSLTAIVTILLCLAVLGGLIVVLAGFSATDEYGDTSPNLLLVAVGIANILLWFMIWAFGRAVAERLRLAAAVAESS